MRFDILLLARRFDPMVGPEGLAALNTSQDGLQIRICLYVFTIFSQPRGPRRILA